MARDKDGPRTWSAAGPHSEEWLRLGEETRHEYNDAAEGVEKGEIEEKETPDEATHDFDLEPSLDEKKEGAALDKAAANRDLANYKARQGREKGYDLGL